MDSWIFAGIFADNKVEHKLWFWEEWFGNCSWSYIKSVMVGINPNRTMEMPIIWKQSTFLRPLFKCHNDYLYFICFIVYFIYYLLSSWHKLLWVTIVHWTQLPWIENYNHSSRFVYHIELEWVNTVENYELYNFLFIVVECHTIEIL